MEHPGEELGASLTNGDSLDGGHAESSSKDMDGKGLKVRKVKAKGEKEKKAKRDKNGTHSEACLLSPTGSFSDNDQPTLAIDIHEAQECNDSTVSSIKPSQNNCLSDIERVANHSHDGKSPKSPSTKNA